MGITYELREWANTFPDMVKDYEKVLAIAEHIDAEHKNACDDAWNNGYEADYLGIEKWLTEHPQVMEHHGWVRLPKDADGEVIHVGDMMERGKARGYVIALMLSEYPKKCGGELHWGVQLEGEQAPTALDAFSHFHHYHEPTVEDVLREFAAQVTNGGRVHGALDIDSAIAECAPLLRLAGED